MLALPVTLPILTKSLSIEGIAYHLKAKKKLMKTIAEVTMRKMRMPTQMR
jgi:hypothetical protein